MKNYGVVEIFSTVQGEGGRAGARSVFLRMSGCNAWNGRPEDRYKGAGACARWCDTAFAKGRPMTADQIVRALDALWPRDVVQNWPRVVERWVVISGGEPALQLDAALLVELRYAGWKVAVETNGSVANDVLKEVDWLTVSPKRGMNYEAANIAHASELKVVLPGVAPGEGLGWTETELHDLTEFTSNSTLLFVQPQDPIDLKHVEVSYLHNNLVRGAGNVGEQLRGQREYEKNLGQCLAFVHDHPAWRVSLQAHKLMSVR